MRRSKVRKSIGLKISPEVGLIITIPKKYDEKLIDKVILSKWKWIVNKLGEIEELKNKKHQLNYEETMELSYIGNKYRLIYTKADKLDLIFNEHTFFLQLPSTLNRVDPKVKRKIIQWYNLESKLFIKARLDEYSKKLNVKPKKVSIKSYKSRWGACNSKQEISFNWKLIQAPLEIIDYVVVHELAHLIEMNHSKKYWVIVNSIFPDYKERRKWLKLNGGQLGL